MPTSSNEATLVSSHTYFFKIQRFSKDIIYTNLLRFQVIILGMDMASIHGRRALFLYGLLVISLILSVNCADAELGDPTGNVNLSPFQKWRSSYECLQNVSNSCPAKYRLNESGWLNVTNPDAVDFCTGGCFQHIVAVLTCIEQVNNEYKFENKATAQDVNNFITHGCAYGFDGTVVPSKASWRKITFLVTILPSLLLMNLLTA